MKKIFLLIFSSILLLGIMGCSNNDDNTTLPPEEDPAVDTESESSDNPTNNESNEDNTKKNDEETDGNSNTNSSNFTDFQLEIKYADQKEYEAEYELENNMAEADIDDDLNNVKLNGDEAIKQLEPILLDLNLKQDTPKEEVISQTLKVFDLPDDYIKFELEITFDDNIEVEYEDEK